MTHLAETAAARKDKETKECVRILKEWLGTNAPTSITKD